jgi:hypothetical protein
VLFMFILDTHSYLKEKSMTKEELFAQQKAKRDAEKAEKANKGNSGGWSNSDYNAPQYVALQPDRDMIFRVLGNPADCRQLPTDPKEFLISTIRYVKDVKALEQLTPNAQRETMKVIWKPKMDGEQDWILWRFFNKVMEYKYDRATRSRIYTHDKGLALPLFNEVDKNHNLENQYESGWYPSTKMGINVIDRQDMAWHKENKKSKILSSKLNLWDRKKDDGSVEKIPFYESGVPRTVYLKLWDDIAEYNGDWELYDVAFRKLAADPWYQAFHTVDDLKKIQADAKPFIVTGKLTEEELSWERYDLDDVFKVTSYLKLMNRIGGYFKLGDAIFGTKFYDELAELAAADKAKFDAEAKDREAKNPTQGSSVTQEAQTQVPAAQEATLSVPAAEAQVRSAAPAVQEAPAREGRSVIPWDKLADGTFNGTAYLGVPQMNDVEKSMVLAINADGSFKYVETWEGQPVQTYKCKESGFFSPFNYHIDPLSGLLF